MQQLKLRPIRRLSGEVTLPGSKSLSNRALLLSALARGSTTLHNLLRSDDIEHMVTALQQLSVALNFSDNWQTCTVAGNHGLFNPPAEPDFYLGNAGTAIRPLTAILGLVDGEFKIDGDHYMRERPIGHLTDALSALGAQITFLQKAGYPPFMIRGGNIAGGEISLPGDISSQYLTALLMALPLSTEDTRVSIIGDQVSKPYLDITLGMMRTFGVQASHDAYQTFNIPANQSYLSPGDYLIEGDASSASYFFAGAAIGQGEITVQGLGSDSVQGDIGFLDAFEAMGAAVIRDKNHIRVAGRGQLKGVDLDLNHIPDAAMTLAAIAVFAEGRTTIRNIYNWRVKETDRMHAMAEGLTRLGAKVNTTADTITIDPPEEVQSATINPYGDHRVAMSFSLAALSGASITIQDPDCTRKTFPDYFNVLDSVSVY